MSIQTLTMIKGSAKDFIASPIMLSLKYELSQCSVRARWQASVSCAHSGEDSLFKIHLLLTL